MSSTPVEQTLLRALETALSDEPTLSRVSDTAADRTPRVPAVAIAYSGGKDSTALLAALSRLIDGSLFTGRSAAVHVFHGIRPQAETETEKKIIISTCIELGIPLYIVQGEWGGVLRRTGAPAKTDKGSPEERARNYRYAMFEKFRRRWEPDLVLLGHHRDDQEETVTAAFLDGALTAAFAGIPVIRRPYLRPFLNLPQCMLHEYVDKSGLPWSQDSTNSDTSIRRNMIRTDLLPLIRARVPDFSARVLGWQKKASLLADFIRSQTEAYEWERYRSTGAAIRAERFLNLHPFLRIAVLQRGMECCDTMFESDGELSVFSGIGSARPTRRHRVPAEFFLSCAETLCGRNTGSTGRKVQGYGYIFSAEHDMIVIQRIETAGIKRGWYISVEDDSILPVPGGWLFGNENAARRAGAVYPERLVRVTIRDQAPTLVCRSLFVDERLDSIRKTWCADGNRWFEKTVPDPGFVSILNTKDRVSAVFFYEPGNGWNIIQRAADRCLEKKVGSTGLFRTLWLAENDGVIL